MEVDIIIVGAGPIGIACGIEAKKAGLSYMIIEKGPLVNSLYNYPLNMTFFSTAFSLTQAFVSGTVFNFIHKNMPACGT